MLILKCVAFVLGKEDKNSAFQNLRLLYKELFFCTFCLKEKKQDHTFCFLSGFRFKCGKKTLLFLALDSKGVAVDRNYLLLHKCGLVRVIVSVICMCSIVYISNRKALFFSPFPGSL